MSTPEIAITKARKRKQKFQIDVTPAHVTAEDENLLPNLGDESLEDEDENIDEVDLSKSLGKKVTDGSRIETAGSASEAATENNQSEDKPYQRKRREPTSEVWKYLDRVTVDGKEYAKCKFCAKQLKVNESRSTSSFKRHIEKCLAKQGKDRQTLLQVQRGGNNQEANISTFKYDHALMREKLSHYIMVCELPFMHVEHFMFNEVMKTATPFWTKVTRGTLKTDCNTTYEIEKQKLKEKFSLVNRINITTDCWTSNQKIGYMVVTGHWIDEEWKLNSRILNFVNVPPPHSGHVIAEALFSCFGLWGIEDKIGTITVDNAKANDVAIRNLKESLTIRKPLRLGGNLFHVRCCAHILNLCVQRGLETIKPIVDSIRDGIKYVAASEARVLKFAEIAKQLKLTQKKLILDVPTRWNSTYSMLDSALGVRQVFPRFANWDTRFQDYVPDIEDWERVENVCKILVYFNEATKVVSGSEYPTSNLFLSEIKRVKQVIDEKVCDQNDYISEMAEAMKEKFEKYWGESNLVMSIGAVMDPRFKMALPKFSFSTLYTKEGESAKKLKYLRDVIGEIYQYYVAEDSNLKGKNSEESNQLSSEKIGSGEIGTLAGVSEFESFLMSSGTNMEPVKSELDDYLSEKVLMLGDSHKNFDIISWWKANSPKYPILSKMARDVLSIPVSTVASESSFSAGSRVIEPHRSCLKPKTVEMLMCGADWVRALYGLKRSSQKEKVKVQEIDLS